MKKVIIVGGVAAGMSAASKLKRNLKDEVDITVFEKGGTVSYGACGIPFYVSGHIAQPEDLIARTPEAFREAGIQVREYHEVISVDPGNKEVTVLDIRSNRTFTEGYDSLIVGSGARPVRYAPFLGEWDNVFTVRTVDDAQALRSRLEQEQVRRVSIIGAGYIGLEMAEACCRHDKEVTLIEVSGRILPGMDCEITVPLTEELKRAGVTVITNTKVEQLKTDGDRVTALCWQEISVPVDLVICCAGIRPNTEFLNGAEMLPNGALKVDCNMATSLPDIYAAGDCSAMRSFVTGKYQYMPLGTNANKQGRIIADHLSGKEPKAFQLIGCSALRLFSLDAAKVGLSEEDARKAGLAFRTNTITGNSYASYYGPEKLTIKLVYEPETLKILGAQLVGQGTVVPRANYFSIAIANQMSADEFGFSDLCYSPPFSGVWDTALIAANTCR